MEVIIEKQASVLVIDDEENLRSLLKVILERQGYQATCCGDVEEALERFRTGVFETVILDVVMPQMSGYEVMDQLRAHRENIPVILMSGFASLESVVEALRRGAYDFLRKPFGREELLKTVDNAVQKVRLKADSTRAAAALAASEERYRTLVENLPDVLYTVNEAGEITTVTANVNRKYGYRPETMIGNPLVAYVHAEDRAPTREVFRSMIAAGKEFGRDLQFRLQSFDGSTHWVAVNIHHSFDESGRFIRGEGIIRNIDQTKKLQQELIRSERLAATGQLAAFVAHEINSPLQAITMLLHSMGRKYPEATELHEDLSVMKGAFDSIRDTVKNLLDLNRAQGEPRQETDLNEVVENTVELLGGYLRKNRIEVEVSLTSGLPKILASPRQLGQVMLNIINNAGEAMTGEYDPKAPWMRRKQSGGTLKICTESSDSLVMVSIQDSGPGMGQEEIKHIFDPFYTGKKKMGMGVGLALCHEIIREHQGQITAGCPAEGGSVFTIELPVGKGLKQERRHGLQHSSG